MNMRTSALFDSGLLFHLYSDQIYVFCLISYHTPRIPYMKHIYILSYIRETRGWDKEPNKKGT